MKLADKIKYKLIAWCRGGGYEIIIPNFYIGQYEMDVFRLMPSGIIVEYEIKISRSDFKNDFTKTNGHTTKHDNIRQGTRKCNRFFFVVPEGLVALDEVPEYCGLIYYDDKNNTMRMVRNAPIVNKTKQTPDYRDIAQRLAFREENARRVARYYKLIYDKKTNENNHRKSTQRIARKARMAHLPHP